MLRVIVALLAVRLCVAMIKNKSRGGVVEWLFILLGCYASISIITEVIR